jgi:hypothetical protein
VSTEVGTWLQIMSEQELEEVRRAFEDSNILSLAWRKLGLTQEILG